MSNALKLGDVAVVKGGSGFPEKYQGGTHGLPFIKVSDMNLPGNQRYIWKSNNYLNTTVYNLLKPTVFPRDTVVFAKVGAAVYLNKRRILTEDTAIDNNLMGVTATAIEPLFLYYLLQSIDLAEWVQPGALPSINQTIIEALPIPITDRKQQRYISEVLNALDNQIDTTQALIDKYTAIKQGMMADLFSRGIDPETKALRPTFEEAPELYHETPLGMLPKGWDVEALSKLAEKITDGDHHTPERSSEGRYLLSARNIHDGYLDFSKVDYVPEYEYKRMIKRCFPEAGDIFISCSGSIGRVCEVPENFSCALVRSVALVKLDNNLVQSSYICWWLRTEKMQKAMINSALQAAQPNLFQGAIEQLDVVLCAPEEQLLISERLNSIENMILLNKSDLKKLKVQKAGLMQDILTGKVPVPA